MASLKEKFKAFIQLDFNTPNAKKALIGTCLFKIGCSGVLLWGQLSLYIYSYYFQFPQALETRTELLLFYIALAPCLLCILFSVRIAEKVGYRRLIRICTVIQPVSVIISSFVKEDLNVFMFFYITCSAVAYGLILLPVLNSSWSHFPKQPGKVSGLAFFFNGMSVCVLSVLAQHLMNPHNIAATVVLKTSNSEGAREIKLFPSEVAHKLPDTIFILGVIYALFLIPSGFLISHAKYDFHQQDQQNNTAAQQQPASHLNRDVAALQPQNMANSYSNAPEIEIELEGKSQQQMEKQQVIDISLSERSDSSNSNSNSPTAEDLIHNTTNSQLNSGVVKTVRQVLKTPTFRAFYLSNAMVALNSIFLSTNLKTYGVTKVNDDQFLTYLGVIDNILGAIFTLLLGPLIDTVDVKKLYLTIVFFYSLTAITLPYATNQRGTFLLWYSIVGIVNSWMMTMSGPILVKYFGVDLAQKLMPIKSTTIFLAIFLLPICLYLSVQIASFDTVFIALGLINFSASILAKLRMAKVPPLGSTL